MYHLISSSTNLYWPSTSQYRHILTQYHQVPLIIHHLMSHAQYTWSSLLLKIEELPLIPRSGKCSWYEVQSGTTCVNTLMELKEIKTNIPAREEIGRREEREAHWLLHARGYRVYQRGQFLHQPRSVHTLLFWCKATLSWKPCICRVDYKCIKKRFKWETSRAHNLWNFGCRAITINGIW